MSQVRTHYDNLQVKENASDEVIKGAYRYLSQKWHPDRNPDNKEDAERVLKLINQAYAVLSEPSKRKKHDEWIKSERARLDGDQTTENSKAPPPPPPKSPHTAPSEEWSSKKSNPNKGSFLKLLRKIAVAIIVFVFIKACFSLSSYMEKNSTLNSGRSNKDSTAPVNYTKYNPYQAVAQPDTSVAPENTSTPLSDEPTTKTTLDSNRLFEPGVNFGAVTSRTSEKALIDLYGPNNVKREAWDLGEWQYRAASAVLKGTKSEFWILWKDDTYTNPERVIVLGSTWKTSEGFRVGLPLESVVKINGRNFLFYGFEWDYGGAVESWERGRLSRFGDAMTTFLTRDFDLIADEATEQAVLGEQSVVSSTSGLDQLKIKVHKIEVAL